MILEKLVATHDPLWRVAAYWLVIIAFFSLPVVVMTVHVLAITEHWAKGYTRQPGEFGYVFEFHRILAAMLATMLGLNSWDKRLVAKNGNGGGVAAPGPKA